MKIERKKNPVEKSCTLSDECFQGTAFSLKTPEVEIDMVMRMVYPYLVDYYYLSRILMKRESPLTVLVCGVACEEEVLVDSCNP
jgi:inorganic pyrophosphatase